MSDQPCKDCPGKPSLMCCRNRMVVAQGAGHPCESSDEQLREAFATEVWARFRDVAMADTLLKPMNIHTVRKLVEVMWTAIPASSRPAAQGLEAASRIEGQSLDHSAVNDSPTALRAAPLSAPCALDQGARPVRLSEEDPQVIWRAIAEEAECVVQQGTKYLLLSEEMCVRLGAALGM